MSTSRSTTPLNLVTLGVALLALVISLGGAAYAVATAPKNSVLSSSIKNGEVKTADLDTAAVATKSLKNGAVTDAKLAPGVAVSAGDVVAIRMSGACTSTPSAGCDDELGSIGGVASVHGTCANAMVDGDGGSLTLTADGTTELDGYRVEDNSVTSFGGSSTLIFRHPANNDFRVGQVHAVLQNAAGRVATLDLTWTINTNANGTTTCDVEGVGVAAG